jgi:hypothetical protein
MRAHHLLVSTLGLLTAACATHHTRSVMSRTATNLPRAAAEHRIEDLGYTRQTAPPAQSPEALRNAQRAWQWWPGTDWWNQNQYRYGYAPARGRPRRVAFWIRPRPDGGWDQVLVSQFAAGSQGGTAAYAYAASAGGGSGVANLWSRWVVHAGTFGPDGRERWPSAEAKADAAIILADIEAAQHDGRATAAPPARDPRRLPRSAGLALERR